MVVVAIVSILSIVGSALVLPYFFLRLPANYFVNDAGQTDSAAPSQLVIKALRNIIGCILVVLGILMLVLPGQGILTMLAGLLVCDFKQKKRLLLYTIRKLRVASKLNLYRERHQRPPFLGL